jgi:branched-chain amino acid transport system substrate-binding protein
MIVKKNGPVILAVFLTLAILPGWASAKEKAVNILISGMMTGPASSVSLPALEGAMDYFNELNSKGGIEGTKINYIASDNRYDVARAISFYQRYRKTPKLALFILHSVPATYALNPLITRDKVPVMTTGGGLFQHRPGYVFISLAPFADIVGADFDWIVADWKKKGNSGMPTVGYMCWEGAGGQSSMNGSMEYAEKLGINLLPVERFPPGSLKFDTYLIRMAEQGANYIAIGAVDPDTTFIVRDAYGLGLTEKIQFVSYMYGFLSTVGLRLEKPEVLEGAVGSTTWLMGDDRIKHPVTKLFSKYRKKPVSEMNNNYLWGVSTAKVAEAAIRIALKEVGYDKINGEAVYKALQKVQGDVTEGMMGPVVFGPKSRKMTDTVKFYRISKGKAVSITDWVKTPDTVSLHKWK